MRVGHAQKHVYEQHILLRIGGEHQILTQAADRDLRSSLVLLWQAEKQT